MAAHFCDEVVSLKRYSFRIDLQYSSQDTVNGNAMSDKVFARTYINVNYSFVKKSKSLRLTTLLEAGARKACYMSTAA